MHIRKLNKRITAYYTVENSVVIPLFTIFIIVMIITALDVHDEYIIRDTGIWCNVALKGSDEDEQYKWKVLTEGVKSANGNMCRRTTDYSEIENIMKNEKGNEKSNSRIMWITKTLIDIKNSQKEGVTK